jgi:hypothetical protein
MADQDAGGSVIRIFIGHDPREEVGTHVFTSSLLQHCTQPVSITPLHKPVLETAFGQKFAQGSNAFTMSRFLVPALADFVGRAVFVDGADMLCRADIADIVREADPFLPVSVVKHEYKTRNNVKYLGTKMEAENLDYDRKQWASVMVMNCWHLSWRRLSPDRVAEMSLLDLLQFKFLQDDQIGELRPEWNWLADEHGFNAEAKIAHFTAGVPGFPAHADVAHGDEWRAQLRRVNYATD